jgi:hypothetical protein
MIGILAEVIDALCIESTRPPNDAANFKALPYAFDECGQFPRLALSLQDSMLGRLDLFPRSPLCLTLQAKFPS